MDFLKNLSGGKKDGEQKKNEESSKGSGGLFGSLSSALGGGESGEKKEDALDKAVDMFQERILKQGPQSNESAVEQLKDEQISDAIRGQYKSMTGREFPIADK